MTKEQDRLQIEYYEPSEPSQVRSAIAKTLILPEDKEKIKKCCKDMNLSMSEFILRAIEDKYNTWLDSK